MAKTPLEIKSLARAHTGAAIKVLVGIMNQGEAPHAARVSAASAILDRGWGKPTQPLSGDDENPLKIVQKIEIVIVDPQEADG